MLQIYTILHCLGLAWATQDPTQEMETGVAHVQQQLRALEARDEESRRQAIENLRKLNAISPEAVMLVVSICERSKDNRIVEDGLRALEALGPKATPAIPFLSRVLLDDDKPSSDYSSYHAGNALTAMGSAAAPAVPLLLKALRSSRVRTRKVSVEALGAIGPDAAPAVPILFDIALQGSGGGLMWDMRDKAQRALAQIGAPALPLLIKGLATESDHHREISAIVLKRMAPPPSETVLPARALLKNAMQAENVALRVEAALAYWNLFGQPDEVLPILLSTVRSHLENRKRIVAAEEPAGIPIRAVFAAISGLERFGADAAPAVDLLVDVLEETRVRALHRQTIGTLGELGGIAGPAIPQLRELTSSPDQTTRQLANEALQKISVGLRSINAPD